MWFCYAGLRVDSFEVDGNTISVVHLVPIASTNLSFLVSRVNQITKYLVEDLIFSNEVLRELDLRSSGSLLGTKPRVT